MKLCDICTIKTNYKEADFWLIRRGLASRCGQPTRQFNKEHIGIKVNQTNILLPDYLYYALLNVHYQGHWERIASGTLSLVNIRVSDVRSIELSPG